MGASAKLVGAHPCLCSFSSNAVEPTAQARICNASSFPGGGICRSNGRVNSNGGDESSSLGRLTISAASEVFGTRSEPNRSLSGKNMRLYSVTGSGFMISNRRVLTNAHCVEHQRQIEGARGSTQAKSCIESNLSPVAVSHRRMSTLSSFRAATFELVSCYNRFSGEEIRKEREGRGKRQRIIVKALRDDSDYEREEQRWMREEQRWLREEQRWLREEQRWLRDEKKWQRDEALWTQANQGLQDEVRALKKEVEELRRRRGSGEEITDVTLRNLVGGMRNLLQALAVPGSEDLPLVDSPKRIPGTVPLGGTPTTYSVEESEVIVSPVTFVASPDKIIAVVTPKTSSGTTPEEKPPTRAPAPTPSNSSQSSNGATSNSPTTTSASRRTLKSGMEGDDVKQLHDALSELGFYSGEEDIEFSVFSDGTESAVKTWQATRRVSEDGKITKELMEALLAEVAATTSTKESGAKKVTKTNSQPTKAETTPRTKQSTPETKQQVSSDHPTRREIDRYERSNTRETGTGSSRRVYLLGENRWEEPHRVWKKQQEETRINANRPTPKMKVGVQLCFACRGAKTMLCTECEGTGDLNVEEQFLEWVDEGAAHCPYCEGTGAISCDVCIGQAVTVQN